MRTRPLRCVAAAALATLAPGQVAALTYCDGRRLPSAHHTAAFDGPMSYRIEVPGGRRVLIAEGAINPGESLRLAAYLDRGAPVDEVWFNSPGGSAAEGPYMGRVLRARGLAVRLRSDHACASACSYAFLGGALRIVEPGGYYGVHMFSGTGDDGAMVALATKISDWNGKAKALIAAGEAPAEVRKALATVVGETFRGWEQSAATLAAIRARYLVEMSLSLDFMTDAFNQSADGMCYLSRSGLHHYNVVNVAEQ